VVLLYLETFGNPRKFGRLARRLARGRPVVVVKGGRSGTVAPGLAGKATPLPEEHVEALFAASGVIRVDTVSELFDAGQLLAYQPLPAGGRVAVVGNSAALALLSEEACVAAGLAVTRRVDIGPTAGPGALASAVRDVLADREVDALVAVFVPVPQRDGGPYADALATAVAGAGKPVVSTFLALEGMPERLRQVSLPSYPSPEVAVRALARVAAYAEWRRRPPGDAPELPGLRPEAGAAVVAAALADHPAGADLAAPDVASLLDAYGIALTPDGDPPGVAVRVELRWDPSFGAIVGYGLAGVATSLFDDWAYRPVPLTDVDAAALVRAPKAAPLLLDHDLDVEALEDLVLRISRLADDHPEVAGLTLDPLIVTPDGCTLRAATAHVTPATRPDAGPRRL
jgi:acyl-CoA synthetase (NDP forming)